MSDGELRFPRWQTPLQELILEFDPETLPEKIQQLKALILQRRRQLDRENGGRVEKIALHDALAIIRIMVNQCETLRQRWAADPLPV
jgi:hypothetical protein